MIFTCYQLILAVLCDDLYALPQPPPRVPQQPGRRAVVTPELVNRLENILKHDKAEEFTWIRDTPSISAAVRSVSGCLFVNFSRENAYNLVIFSERKMFLYFFLHRIQ